MLGKLPFPHWACVTPIKVYLTELSEDGEPVEELVYDGLCIYSDKSREKLNAHRELINITGKVIIEGDIAPKRTIKGHVLIDGYIKANIEEPFRPRNPDGTVFSTELELI